MRKLSIIIQLTTKRSVEHILSQDKWWTQGIINLPVSSTDQSAVLRHLFLSQTRPKYAHGISSWWRHKSWCTLSSPVNEWAAKSAKKKKSSMKHNNSDKRLTVILRVTFQGIFVIHFHFVGLRQSGSVPTKIRTNLFDFQLHLCCTRGRGQRFIVVHQRTKGGVLLALLVEGWDNNSIGKKINNALICGNRR